MSRSAYIFVNRNFGHDYAYAYPPLGLFRSWLWRLCIYPEIKKALDMRVQYRRDQLSDVEFQSELAKGISVHTCCRKHTIYSIKIAPDTLCPDPRAQGRLPYFVMHLLMPGFPEIISRRYEIFRSQCQEIAWNTMQSGELSELRVNMPEELY